MRELIERGTLRHGETECLFVPSPRTAEVDAVEFTDQVADAFGVRGEPQVGYEKVGTVYPAGIGHPPGAARVLYIASS